MKVYFVTANEKKIAEIDGRLERFLERAQAQGQKRIEIEICPFKKHLDELLALDIQEIVRKKALEAYRAVRLPCVVEHGGLCMDAWRTSGEKSGLLGGIGQIVWDAVGDRMCHFLRKEDDRGAEAQSVIGYCDGKRIRTFCGTTRGEVTDHARGDHGFRWDPIFKPTGSEMTYGEMAPEEKRKTSPDEKAWDLFLQSLQEESLHTRVK